VAAPILFNFPQNASAETSCDCQWIRIKPMSPFVLRGSIGHNWTITFQVEWSVNGTIQPIRNASAEISVSENGKLVKTFECNTTDGTFSFWYISDKPAFLVFGVSKLVTEDQNVWGKSSLEGLFFNADGVCVIWDTYDVHLVNYNVDSIGSSTVSVNVTYHVIPEGGTFLIGENGKTEMVTKTVSNATVTINSVEAQETSTPGIYTANVPEWFPTAYTLVTVSQDGWQTTNTGFSGTHNANLNVWLIALAAIATFAGVSLLVFKLRAFKANKDSKRPFLGGIFLLFAAVISLYWSAIGFIAVWHGFSWLTFAILEICCFLLGVICAAFAIARKNQAAIIFSVSILLVVNTIVVMFSLGDYGFPSPWLLVGAVFVCCAVAFFFVSNADEEFDKTK
jgi:hypothetical protein